MSLLSRLDATKQWSNKRNQYHFHQDSTQPSNDTTKGGSNPNAHGCLSKRMTTSPLPLADPTSDLILNWFTKFTIRCRFMHPECTMWNTDIASRLLRVIEAWNGIHQYDIKDVDNHEKIAIVITQEGIPSSYQNYKDICLNFRWSFWTSVVSLANSTQRKPH